MAKLQVTLDNLMDQFNTNIERLETDPKFRHDVIDGHPEGNPVLLGPRVITADEWVTKMTEGATNRAATWLKNTLAPKKDPKQAALKAAGKYKTNTQAALNEGRWDKGITAYDEAARTAVITEGGTAAFTEGVRRHKAKAVAKVNKLQPLIAALATTIDAMPQDTDAQREAKMLAAKRGMQEIGKKLRGG
jgi:hypothetical protein